ncbi:hypothetical protein A6A05_00475 [Magnetospirillum moscoviense]|uniref:Carrier domain-containing protein n=1 Tax=Magnetospirillum moscoviense TaxID=1437059 RepID=A0A178MWR3_9PROT|nr:hypothetical protein A6A05_00475 [Magnetospirillum moscoviense]
MIVEYLQATFLFDLRQERLDDRSNLFEAGFVDSYGLVELVGFLERTFSIRLTDSDLTSPRLASIDGMVRMVAEKGGAISHG